MKVTIVSNAKLHKMFEDEERGLYDLRWIKEIELEGLLYSVYKDRKTNKHYGARAFRTVSFGLNSIPEDKKTEFVEIVKREGRCDASWSCTGRTLHQMLANQLAAKHPEFRWEIGYNYECRAYDDHAMVLMPGFEPEVDVEI